MKHWTERQGVWVETDQGVGIRVVEKVDAGAQTVPVGWIHLVNSDGTTLAQIPEASCTNVRIARRLSIPASRIEGLSADQLGALGYV